MRREFGGYRMARCREVIAATREESSSSVTEVEVDLEGSSLGKATVRSAANCCCW